jgi:hypothetical protein
MKREGKSSEAFPVIISASLIASAVRWFCLQEDMQTDSLSVGGIGGLQLMTDAAVKSSVMMIVFISA